MDKGFAYTYYRTTQTLLADRTAQKARHTMPTYEYTYTGHSTATKADAIAAAKAKGLQPVLRFQLPTHKT